MTDYELFKGLKVCVQCRAYDAVPGRVRCEVCLAQNAESSARKVGNETFEQAENRKSKHREYLKRLRHERKERGVCIYCEKPLAKGSTIYCIDHKIKKLKANRVKANIPRNERHYYNLCYFCDGEIREGKKVCEKCYERCRSHLPNPKTNSHYDRWKRDNKLVFLTRSV